MAEAQINIELFNVARRLRWELEKERPYQYSFEEAERLAAHILGFIEARKDYGVKELARRMSPLACLRTMQLLENIDERLQFSPCFMKANP